MLQLLAASLLTAKQQLIYFIFIKFFVSTPSILRKRWWCLTMLNTSCFEMSFFSIFLKIFLKTPAFLREPSLSSLFSDLTKKLFAHKKTFWTLFFKKDFRSNHHQNLCFLGGHICFCLSMCLPLQWQYKKLTLLLSVSD